MSDLSFGRNLQLMRKKAGLNSKELSTMVGKSPSYVSQIENDRNKCPDYETAYQLMKLVGYEEMKIDGILEYYGIMSPQKEKALLEAELRYIEEQEKRMSDPDYAEAELERQVNLWLDHMEYDLKQRNDTIFSFFNKLIEKDISRAERFIPNIEYLTSTKINFDFFFKLIDLDYQKLSSEEKEEVLELIERFINERSKTNAD